MDKSKSRTDLLAAGRKKLQQFRQKKDGKGSGSSSSSHGKSSKTHVKVEKHDAKAVSVSSDDRSAESSHLIGDEIVQQHADSSTSHVDSSVSLSAGDVTPEIDYDKADESSLRLRQETNVQTHDMALQPDSQVNEADIESHKVLTTTVALVFEEDTDANSLHHALDHHNISLIGTSGDHMVDGSLSEAVFKYEVTEEPPRILGVDTVVPDIRKNADETHSEAKEKSTSSRGTSTNLPSEVGSFRSDSLLSSSTPVQVIAVEAASLSQDLEVKDSHLIHDVFTQVEEDQLADEGSTHEFEHKTLPPEPSGILDVEGAAPNEAVSTMEHEVEASNLGHPSASKMFTSEQETSHSISLLPASEEQIAATANIHRLENETQHSFPDLSLIQARQDQEADFPGTEKLAGIIGIEVDEDKKRNEVLTFAGSIPVFDASNKSNPATTPEVFVEMRRDVITLDDDDTQLQSDISDIERSVGGSQGDAIRQVGHMGFSSDENSCPRLVHLANSLKDLNEDEYRILMKITNSDVQVISGDTDRYCDPNHGFADVLDVYKEHIYVANVLKDIFYVQLLEQYKPLFDTDHMHQQCDDKVSKLEISLEESKERNRTLDEELMLCQSELRTTLKNVEELSSAIHEWKEKYFRSEGDMSIISKDLYEYRSLVENLQREKEDLNGSIKSMLDERNQHVEEKENMSKENEKLVLEAGELKSQLADVLLQNESLIDNMNLATENMRELNDERENFVQENKILSLELADCKNLLADVHAKHSSATESITILTEEKTRLQSQQHDAFLDIEKLTVEMAESKNRMALLEAENQKLSVSLSSEAEEKKKLEEERQCLLHDSDVLSSENRAFQEALLSEKVEKLDLEADKHKVNLMLEQLIEESIFLRICLEMLKSNDEESEGATENQHSVNKSDKSSFVVDPSFNGSLTILCPRDDFTFAVLKKHLDNVERAIRNLDESIDELHTHPLYAQECDVSATEVNKQIQSSKSEEIRDDHEEEEFKISADNSSLNTLSLVKERAHAARAVLNQFCLVVGNSKELFMKDTGGRHIDDAASNETDVQHSALQDHDVYLERDNIELQVQNEALKENLQCILAKYSETTTMNELVQKLQLTHESENIVYAKKLKDCQSRVSEMHNQSLVMKHNLGKIAPCFLNQIRNMEMEITEALLWVDNHWNSIVTQIIGFLGRLDSFSSGLIASSDPPFTPSIMEIANRVGASVDSAISFIKRLQDDFEALKLECQSLECLYKEVHGSYTSLCKENAASVELLHKVHGSLRSLVVTSGADETGSLLDIEPGQLLDPSQISDYMMLIEQLRKDLYEKTQLKCENAILFLELDNRTKEMEEIRKKVLDMHVIAELVELAEKQLALTTLETDSNIPLTLRIENCISSLLQAQKEANEKDNLIKEECESTEDHGGQMQEELQRLIALNMQQEIEIKSLRLNLSEAEEQLIGVQTELQRKVAEAEQSEQRVSSIREKLSIAVAKGKGLIVQRDNLKQSLAETSSELEKSRQQLHLSANRLLEAETKLKTYAEAGERVEALESELSYIRNSATALRESFLLKDSVLQRIEEILEDLELPEHLHSSEIIDKVDWLARSVVGNSNALSATAWDQKSIPDVDSYADNGFVVMNAWKGNTEHNSSSSDDLRIKHEELQNKFYGLAEQNEMLEQSLLERNSIVQRLEEVLDKINMPAHLQSMEAASQIEWLAGALSDALQHASTLQESVDHHKTHCEKLLAELEESQGSFSGIKSVLESTIKDKEHLQSILADLIRNIDNFQERVTISELENSKMQIEIDDLQVKLVENNDYRNEIESGIRRMLDLICTVLRDHSLVETAPVDCNILQLEEMLRRLIDDYKRKSAANNIPGEIDVGSVEKAVSTHDDSGEVSCSDHDATYLKNLEKELEEALSDLTHVKEERDIYKEKHKSLSDEMEAVRKQHEELQQLLNQEEQRSASLREKLNVAVRKGKSLVQQRDSLKQTIEEMNIKLDSLTSEINNHLSTITQYEEKFRELSSYAEKVHASESENQMLRSQLTKTEHYLQEEVRTLSSMLDILNGIQLNGGFKSRDPIDKLHQIGKAYHDLLEARANSDKESVKSKRAAELLLAELNEVQERNDTLQDELAKVVDELSELSKANQILEAARVEALSQLANFSAAQKDDQKKQNIQIVELKSRVDQFLKFFKDVTDLLADVFSMDMDFFKSLDFCLDESGGLYVYGGSLRTEDNDKEKKFFGNGISAWEKFIASDSWLMYRTQEQFKGSVMDDIFGYVEYQIRICASTIGSVKDKLESYTTLKAQEATRVSTNLRSFQGETASRIKSLERERETERNALLKNIAILYEACADSIQEIGNRTAPMSTNNPSSMDTRMNVRSAETEENFSSEESIRALSERLTAAVRDLSNAEQEILEADRTEMKYTIANLQMEIQEKDIQKERICMELVGQIKRAEAAAANYSHDLEVATSQVYDLKTQVSAIEKDKNLLEQKMKEMKDEKTASIEMQEKVRSMADMLSAKDQEIESLMQALDEEESELEEMSKKVEQMEMELQQKNREMGKLEHSHSKAMKKLSVTVSKFDELHDLSAGLLSEVEKLQMQVQERDNEISFLRQEVTRCTNDILLASQSKNNSDEIIELYEWMKTVTSQVDMIVASPKDLKLNDVHVYKESIQNQIASIVSELEDLQHIAGSRNEMLQVEKNRVQELVKKRESLETALRQKEDQLNLLEEAPTSSGIGGIEQLENNWAAPGPSTSSQVRSLRKSNNDQVAIAIDDDPATGSRFEDEDEDKVHGFKSLTTSRIVPRFTRPVSDMIDGLWVSCDRALMRQPALRLSIIFYWALLHALLAAFVV